MTRRWPVFLLLVSPAVLLVSLYLPWQKASCGTSSISNFQSNSGTAAGLPNLFAGSCLVDHVTGWSSVGEVAAIAALLLTFLSALAFAQPDLRHRLPLVPSGLLVGYLAVAVLADTRIGAQRAGDSMKAISSTPIPFHYAYGTYVGAVASIAALTGAGFLGRERLSSRPSLGAFVGILAALALLVALLLPWVRSGFTSATRQSLLGIETPPGAIAAILALRLAVACWSDKAASSLERLGLAIGALIFTGAAFTANFPAVHAYGSWIGLRIGIMLVLATLARGNQISIPRLRPLQGVSVIASAVLVMSLFLPWQTACYGNTASFKVLRLSGRCVSTNGFDLIGAIAAAVSCALVFVVLTPRFPRISMLELAAGLALLVATFGFRLEDGNIDGARLGFGYGSFTGFVATGLLVLLALGTRRWKFNFQRLGVRAPAIVLCLSYLVAVVTPWWGVLPSRVWTIFPLHGLGVSWLTVAGALLGVRLLANWVQESRARSEEVVLLPIALVALTILELVPFPHMDLTWSSGLLLGLAFALAILGLVAHRGGIRSLSVPEILRIDRI